MPPKLLYQASTGLAKPAAQIMNNIANFILYNQVLSEPQATIANFIDYKQGFNRCQHSICIEILAQEDNVHGWLLKILVGYLPGRTMKVRFKGHVGKEKDIQCGLGQGAPLGMWIFWFMIDRMDKANMLSNVLSNFLQGGTFCPPYENFGSNRFKT